MFATPAYAQAAGDPATGAAAGFSGMIPFFGEMVLIGLLFYFLLYRPQAKRAKEQRLAIAAAAKGDEVTTAGGIVGKVTKVDGDLVEVEIAQGVKVRVVKSTLAAINPRGGAKPAND
jgi:preprotein translocase subunit YajC